MSFLNFINKKSFFIKLFSVFISFFLFLGFFNKTEAYAGVLDVVIDPANYVQTSVSAVSNAITSASSVVNTAMTTAEKLKVFVIDPAARVAIRTIIRKLTAQTVNWINSGFQGNPAFVTDPKQFFLSVGDNVASNFLSGSSVNQLCTPFKAQIRLALVKNYVTENENYSCTLSILKNNFNQFTQDFSQGGWDGWFEVTQSTENNPYNAYFAAKSELSRKIDTEKTKYQAQLSLGNGFLSYEKCKPSSVLSQSDINSLGAAGTKYKVGDCWINPQTGKADVESVTPGGVIEKQLEGALGTGLKQLELAKSFDEILSALVTQLFSRVVGGGSGTGNNTDQLLDRTIGGMATPQIPTPGTPTIALQGLSPMNVMTGTRFNDPWVVAFDSKGNDISNPNLGLVTATGTVLTSIPGQYLITYTAEDPQTLATSSVTRNVIVGITSSKNACLDPWFMGIGSNFPTILSSFRITYHNINENDIKVRTKLMIELILKERDYLKQQKQDEIVTDLDDLMVRLDQFQSRADRSDENSIEDVLTLQKQRDELKNYIQQLLAKYTCNIPAAPFTDPAVSTIEIPAPGGGGGTCTPPSGPDPHPNFQAEVAQGKANTGMTFSTTSPECPDRFSIVQEAVKLIPGAGYYTKNYGNNCNGFAVDIVAFSDGYIYDVLNGAAPDGNGPTWNQATCAPPDPSRYYKP
jgi:hypothetical protein